MRSSSNKTKEKVIASQLKEVFDAKGVSTRGGTAKLLTGGPNPLSATLGQHPDMKAKPKFSSESLTRLQLKMGASDNKMKILSNYLRINCGRHSVEKLQQHMIERNKRLEDFFEVKNMKQTQYVTTEGEENNNSATNKKKKREASEVLVPVVYANDVEGLASLVMAERGLSPENSLVQIGIDDGQHLLKVMMSVKEKDPDPVEPKLKKAKYEEGFAPQDFKMSGVKKLILLLVSPTTERHDNMKALLDLLKMEALDFGLCCDLKMVNILLGKQSASSKFCCPFCLGCSPWQGSFTTITVGSLWKDYTSFVVSGSSLKNAKDFHNVVHPPLITGRDDMKILGDIFFVPEHHVFTGIHGKLVKELERNAFDSPDEGVRYIDKWMESPGINITRTVYHGSASFVGNMALKFLTKVEDLEARMQEDLSRDKFDVAEKYMQAFKKFRAVVKGCFGQTLSPDYPQLIEDFMIQYRSLDISIPLKVHILETHVHEFLLMKGEKYGLGFYSEQAMESMHQELKEDWGADKVDIKHPAFGPKLRKTVVRVNGKHI